MAHGTGRYSINMDKDVKVDNIIVKFYRTKYYYHEQMSDLYEPTWEWTDDYTIRVYRECKHKVFLEDVVSKSVDKDTANKVWWNITHRQMTGKEVLHSIREL